MWYSVSSQDIENSLEKRLAARPAHLARLQALASLLQNLTVWNRHNSGLMKTPTLMPVFMLRLLSNLLKRCFRNKRRKNSPLNITLQ